MNFEEIVKDCVAYAPAFINHDLTQCYFSDLLNSIEWRQEHISFGKDTKVALPRLVAWYGDPGARYFYSGIQNEPRHGSNHLFHYENSAIRYFPTIQLTASC